MGANVFANGKEISGKGSGNKTIAAMPDVCLSPPSPPAGPIPIPYPNFSQASDTTDGSKKVKIGGKEVCLKGKSSFKKSKGDEAATNSFGASVVSHKIQGAVKHQAGSFDVKIEGSNVARFGDITTGNHSNPGLPPGPDVGVPAVGVVTDPECKALQANNDSNREKSSDTPAFATTKVKYKNNRTGVIATASAHKSASRHINGLTPGPGAPAPVPGKKNKYKSEICGGGVHEYTYNGVGAPPWSHAEARMLESLFSATKGAKSLVVAINWTKGADTLNRPCSVHCKKALCKAKECIDEIVLCKDGKKEPLEC